MATVELPQYGLYVAGGSFPPAGGRFYDTIDPYTGRAVGAGARRRRAGRGAGGGRGAHRLRRRVRLMTGFQRSRLTHPSPI
ncbi:MAG TPA: hypothetical protein VN213_08075 [Solirubrobacteraceae bacterium]|nr:hypothetical protein [Solirubrobacteraceae bacterium]